MYWLSSAWEEEAMTHVFPWVSHVDADVVYIWRYYVWAWDKKKSGGKSTNTKTAYPLWRWQLCIYVKTSFARAFITPPLLLYKVSLPFFATPQTACCSQGHGRMPDFDCLNPPPLQTTHNDACVSLGSAKLFYCIQTASKCGYGRSKHSLYGVSTLLKNGES